MAREQRKLAAILAADVVGYSRLMGRDESGTLARLREHRKERLEPALARYGGRLVKLTGDGVLVEFASAVDAVSAAIEVQQAVADTNKARSEAEHIVFRIGLHLGDLIVDGDDLYGDGVNIAARLEAEAPPGGIVISRNVHEAVAGRLAATFDDLGSLALRNIERPVQAFSVNWQSENWQPSATADGAAVATAAALSSPTSLSLPDKPSIAVLPFQNMSGDPEQEYFVDGLVEEIITALSRFKSLFVIARNSSFTYKGKAVDIKQVARELGVRYVLEGSVRKVANRVRITGQLILADSGAHIWAERYDGDLADIFELQDKLTSEVVGAIAPRLDLAEIDRVRSKPTDNLGAYDLYLRGLAELSSRTPESVAAAREFGYRAIALDPNFAAAHSMTAFSAAFLIGVAQRSPSPEEVAEAARLVRRAVDLGRDDALVLAMAGWAMAHMVRDLDAALGLVDRAFSLNPDLVLTRFARGWLGVWKGEHEQALEDFARVMRLSPLDPSTSATRIGIAHALFMLGRYEDAIAQADKDLAENRFAASARIAAASAALAGRAADADRYLALYLKAHPELRVSNLQELLGPYRRPEDLARYKEGLRRAGLAE